MQRRHESIDSLILICAYQMLWCVTSVFSTPQFGGEGDLICSELSGKFYGKTTYFDSSSVLLVDSDKQ